MSTKTDWTVKALCIASAAIAGITIVSAMSNGAAQIPGDQKAKVKGTIMSRAGDLVKVNDKKMGSPVIVVVDDGTKVERKKGRYEFFVHKDMDVTALVPGLTIEAEG